MNIPHPKKRRRQDEHHLDCEHWDIERIVQWLDTKQLLGCEQRFREHRITGAVLLNLTPKDFDSMGIKALGQRKKLLRSIQELRRKSNMKQKGATPNRRAYDPATSSEASASSPRNGDIPTSATSSATLVRPMPQGVPPPPAAGDSCRTRSKQGSLLEGTYDEDSSRNSFREALEAWRSSNKHKENKIVIHSETETSSAADLGKTIACWNCFKVYAVSKEHVARDGRSVCSKECVEKHHASLNEKQASMARSNRSSENQRTPTSSTADRDPDRLWQLDISY